MKFPNPLLKGILVRRYKRFMADIVLETGEEITAHCANSGSMMGVKGEGVEVWVSPANNPKRKLKYTWELIKVGKSLVGINTSLSNKIAQESIETGVVAELQGYDTLRSEVKYGKNSRIDLLLENPFKPACYVEIKNVTLRRDRSAEFPDSVTARGTKHLAELANQVAAGDRAVMYYLTQREDCDTFTVAKDIDPEYATALEKAMAAGVEVICYGCKLTPEEIQVISTLSIEV